MSTDTKNTRLTRNPAEAAELLGIGHMRVRELVRSGELATLPGRNINIPLVSIERYLERITGAQK
jgi:excisionase family DNA binding protein